MTHPWTEVLAGHDPAVGRSLALAFEAEFGMTMEACPEHMLTQGWNYVRWYLDVHRDLPPGNMIVNEDGRALDPRPYLGIPPG